MVEKRCPDTGQIINFSADCEGCEFLRIVDDERACGYHIKAPGGSKKQWR